MSAEIVTIDLGERSYDIYIGSGLLYRFKDFMPEELDGKSLFIVTDKNVQPYAETIKVILSESGARRVELIVLPAGEQTKSFAQVEKLTSWLLKNGIDRSSMIFAVGGGVIGDLTGFVASITMRGIPFVQVPTTLLSMVDSSVGGKTGINTKHGKNLVGSFYQPSAVIIDIETLKTLPTRELLAGYAEVVKYGLINDEGFFSWLEDNFERVLKLDLEALSYIIKISTQAKADVVQADEREIGQRALLNLGHTFGHALEAEARYDGRLLHGEAVAIGTIMAFDLSARMGLCSHDEVERVEKHFISAGLPTRASYVEPGLNTTPERLLNIMSRDKKVSNGKLTFVLVKGVGEAYLSSDVPMDLVRDILKDSLGKVLESIKERWKGKEKLSMKERLKSAFSS